MNYVDSLNFFGIEAKEIPCVKGSGAPIDSTVGVVGLLYMNTDNGDVYKCTAVNGSSYTWLPMGNSSQGSGSECTVDYVVQDTAPENTSVLWVDTSDNSDDGFQEAVNMALAQAKASGEFDGKSIIDVTELPTENIREDVFYRLLTGSLVINQVVYNAYTCHCVESLPETGLPATNLEQTEGHVYFTVGDGELYGYVDEMLSMGLGVPAGWYPCATLLEAIGSVYSGVITNIMDDPKDETFRLLIEHVIYSYKDSWTFHKTIGWAGTGMSAEIFNYPLNEASGLCAHAEGIDTHAEGDSSHAEGNSSHAEGNSSHAEGDSSHAEGYSSHAVGRSQHVQGEYNLTDPEYNPDTPYARAKYAHIVGNGTATNNRSNAHTLDWGGNAWYAGNIYLGGNGQDDPEAVMLRPVHVTGAKVGQTVKIAEVDENGVPTAWEAVEFPSGGVTSWNDLTDRPFYTEEITSKTVFTSEDVLSAEHINVGPMFEIDYLPAYKFSDVVLDFEQIAKCAVRDLCVTYTSGSSEKWDVVANEYSHDDEFNYSTCSFGTYYNAYVCSIACLKDDTIAPRGLYFVPFYLLNDTITEASFTIELPTERYHKKLREEYIPNVFVVRLTEKNGRLVGDKGYSEILYRLTNGDMCFVVNNKGNVFTYSHKRSVDKLYELIFTGYSDKFVSDYTTFATPISLQLLPDDFWAYAYPNSRVYIKNDSLILESPNGTYFSLAVNDDGTLTTSEVRID